MVLREVAEAQIRLVYLLVAYEINNAGLLRVADSGQPTH